MRGKTKHQDRLFSYVPIEQRVSKTHLTEVVAEAEREGLISKDHFTVDGTVVQAHPFRACKSYIVTCLQDPQMLGVSRPAFDDFKARRRPEPLQVSAQVFLKKVELNKR